MGTVDRGRPGLAADHVEVPGTRVVFAPAVALMVLDFADRQVVVATFRQLHAEWGLSDAQHRALVSVVSILRVGLGAFMRFYERDPVAVPVRSGPSARRPQAGHP
jgi:hypothetical protein